MTTDPWRKDSPAVDAAKRALAMRKGKPTEADAPPPTPFAGPKPKPLPGAALARRRARVTVAALYVDPNGVYANLPGVEVWDESRDARTYAGPWPVVAHPPCARWSPLVFIHRALYGYGVGDDGGCFAAALAAVRRFGGVLEHPANSLAWRRFGLTVPARNLWASTLLDPGWVTEVSQSAYGHRARKRTWLYLIGNPQPLDWSEPEAVAQVSSFRHAPAGEYVPCESSRVRGREASATPERFRDELIRLAKCVGSP